MGSLSARILEIMDPRQVSDGLATGRAIESARERERERERERDIYIYRTLGVQIGFWNLRPRLLQCSHVSIFPTYRRRAVLLRGIACRANSQVYD